MTLSLPPGIFCRSGEYFAAIRECHIASTRIVGAVFCLEPVDLDFVTDLKNVLRNASSLQHARRSTGESPCRDLARGILYIDVKPDVGVLPFDFTHHPLDFHWLGIVILSRERMVRQKWCAQEQHEQKGNKCDRIPCH